MAEGRCLLKVWIARIAMRNAEMLLGWVLRCMTLLLTLILHLIHVGGAAILRCVVKQAVGRAGGGVQAAAVVVVVGGEGEVGGGGGDGAALLLRLQTGRLLVINLNINNYYLMNNLWYCIFSFVILKKESLPYFFVCGVPQRRY